MDSPSIPGTSIEGEQRQFAKTNSSITFPCHLEIDEHNAFQVAKFKQLKKKRIDWLKNGQKIDFEVSLQSILFYQKLEVYTTYIFLKFPFRLQRFRGGLSIQTEWHLHSVTSRLTLGLVQQEDNGVYTCTTTDPDYTSDSIELVVVDGESSNLNIIADC